MAGYRTYVAEAKSDPVEGSSITYKIEIVDTELIGSAIEFTLGGDLFSANFECGDNAWEKLVVGTEVSVPFIIENSYHETFYENLVNAQEGRFIVNIYRDDVRKWSGVLVTDLIDIPDEYYPQALELSATDGFGLLKTKTYDNDGTIFRGSATVVEHLINILNKLATYNQWLGTDLYLETAVNWFDTAMSPGGDPAGKTQINHNTFVNYDDYSNLVGLSCYDVLEQLCLRFNARIFQDDGAFRFINMRQYSGYSMKISRYYKDGSIITSTSIDRSQEEGVHWYREAGGIARFLPVIQKVNLEYDFQDSVNAGNLLPPVVNWNENDKKITFSGTFHNVFIQPDSDIYRIRVKILLQVGNLYWSNSGWNTSSVSRYITTIGSFYNYNASDIISFITDTIDESDGGVVAFKIEQVLEVSSGASWIEVPATPSGCTYTREITAHSLTVDNGILSEQELLPECVYNNTYYPGSISDYELDTIPGGGGETIEFDATVNNYLSSTELHRVKISVYLQVNGKWWKRSGWADDSGAVVFSLGDWSSVNQDDILTYTTEEIPSSGLGYFRMEKSLQYYDEVEEMWRTYITIPEYVTWSCTVVSACLKVKYTTESFGSGSKKFTAHNTTDGVTLVESTSKIDLPNILTGDVISLSELGGVDVVQRSVGELKVYDSEWVIPDGSWTEGYGAGSGIDINKMLVREVLALCKLPRKIWDMSIRSISYSPMCVLKIGTEQYMFLGGTFNARLGQWKAKWMKMVYDDTHIIFPSTQVKGESTSGSGSGTVINQVNNTILGMIKQGKVTLPANTETWVEFTGNEFPDTDYTITPLEVYAGTTKVLIYPIEYKKNKIKVICRKEVEWRYVAVRNLV